MDRDLARKRPVTVLQINTPAPVPVGKVTIQLPTRAAMERKLGQLWEAGRIEPDWRIRPGSQGWTADVTFRPRPVVRHARPTPWLKIWAGSMVSILALLTAYTLIQALATALAAIVPFIAGGALLLGLAALLAGRKIVNVYQNVNVK